MRSDQQTDIFRDDPAAVARAYRVAADVARINPYHDERTRKVRADYYTEQAERLERQEKTE